MPRERKKLPTDEVDALFWLVYDGPGALGLLAEDDAKRARACAPLSLLGQRPGRRGSQRACSGALAVCTRVVSDMAATDPVAWTVLTV